MRSFVLCVSCSRSPELELMRILSLPRTPTRFSSCFLGSLFCGFCGFDGYFMLIFWWGLFGCPENVGKEKKKINTLNFASRFLLNGLSYCVIVVFFYGVLVSIFNSGLSGF